MAHQRTASNQYPLVMRAFSQSMADANAGLLAAAEEQERAELDQEKMVEEEIIQPMLRDTSEEARAGRRRLMLRAVIGEFMATCLFIFVVCAISVNSSLSGISAASPGIASLIGAVGTGFTALANIYAFADIR
jgi:hypothetical protein